MDAFARFCRRVAVAAFALALLGLIRSWLTAYYILIVAAILWAIGLMIPALAGGAGGFALTWQSDTDRGAMIFQRRPGRLTFMAGLPLVLLILVRPSIVKRWQDAYDPYTGVVVRRGFDLSFFSSRAWDYLVIRTPDGREEKRYATVFRYARDSSIEVGDSIVKERGWGNRPRIVRRP